VAGESVVSESEVTGFDVLAVVTISVVCDSANVAETEDSVRVVAEV
jgi:hypothetical protein